MRLTLIIIIFFLISCKSKTPKKNLEINYNDIITAIYKYINPKDQKLIINEYIEVDPNNCEVMQWLNNDPYRFVDNVDSLGNFIYDEKKHNRNLTGFSNIKIDTSAIKSAYIFPIIVFNKDKLMSLHNVTFTKDIYKINSFRISPAIQTNVKDIYILFSSFINMDNSRQHNFTIKITNDNIEILDHRFIDYCYLGADIYHK